MLGSEVGGACRGCRAQVRGGECRHASKQSEQSEQSLFSAQCNRYIDAISQSVPSMAIFFPAPCNSASTCIDVQRVQSNTHTSSPPSSQSAELRRLYFRTGRRVIARRVPSTWPSLVQCAEVLAFQHAPFQNLVQVWNRVDPTSTHHVGRYSTEAMCIKETSPRSSHSERQKPKLVQSGCLEGPYQRGFR
ncbi:hypothetical protein EJ04DRAFT_335114 [Polyplosphaeria fusca]|uniref:Uncharacterized protein n=1 Tax=Polyplosphaeria fusca TaxID=682080 RepID=A0A9P4R628_9PLEO|nr:hypothetical protein EJ04DRAFT_335114 [Polyplosphaeria fusca]